MKQTSDPSAATSQQLVAELGRRLDAIRLARNISQADLAEAAGVVRSTLVRMANGKGVSLDSFVRVMQALQLSGHLEKLLPDPAIRPVERLRFQGRERQRARGKARPSREWQWDKELADPQGYGRIEYAYSRMAAAAGIWMARCHLHEEGGRAHFMTRRFDRPSSGGKLHMQSLGAMKHYDYNAAGAYAYEQALQVIRQLRTPMTDVEEQLRRACFNLIARNQDDHVKNIAFVMSKQDASWRLSPA